MELTLSCQSFFVNSELIMLVDLWKLPVLLLLSILQKYYAGHKFITIMSIG